MIMTPNEIYRKYMRNSNRKTYIRILAELNGCDKKRIIEIIIDQAMAEDNIQDLGLTKQTSRLLTEKQIRTGNDLKHIYENSFEELRRMQGIGPIRLEEIKKRLEERIEAKKNRLIPKGA